ncbi:MAG: hypothetical protein ABJC87_18320 [Roseobacter sp.]
MLPHSGGIDLTGQLLARKNVQFMIGDASTEVKHQQDTGTVKLPTILASDVTLATKHEYMMSS